MSSSEIPFGQGPAGSNVTTHLILTRRSMREQYEDRILPADVLAEIVRCGLAAPSSKNARPWRLHIVEDRLLLRELADEVATADGADTYVPHDPETGRIRTDWPSSVAESAAVLASVPVAIFIENLGAFSKGRATLASVPNENLRGSLVAYTFEVLGIGAALTNMWIAAISLGVQAVFMGDICVAEKRIAEKLGLQRDLVGVLALGYSRAPVSPDRVHYDISDQTRVVWHGGAK